ncbi:MAG: HAD family acid phosphatase [Planctomycetota bacterium]|jgi:acid phosphatase
MLRYLPGVVLVLGITAAAAAADELVLGTFNCEFLLPAKVHLKYGFPFELEPQDAESWSRPGYRKAQYDKAVEAVAGYLATLDADILVLTEVGTREEVEPLVAALREHGQPYPHWDVGDSADEVTGQHVAVLSRRPLATIRHGGRAVIPGRETYDVELDDADKELETGIQKGMHVRFTAGGRPVHLIGLHLKSERGGHEADAKRIAQASVVRRYYLPLVKRGEHVIVAGDLNDDRGQPSMRRIRGRDDIHEDLYQTGSPIFFAGDRWRALAYRWTQTYQGVRSQVDHILLSPSIIDACGLETVEPIFPRQSDAFVSDHRPVLVRLAFPEQAAAAAAGGDHPALAATAWVQTSVEYRMVAEAAYDRAAECLDRLVTDSDALADPDHRPAPSGTGPQKVAVVMDVDQTILDDSPYVVRLVSSGRWHDQSAEEEWAAWCRQAAATAVPGAAGFIEAVRALDRRLANVELRVFLITNRDASLEAATITNLQRQGIEIDPEAVLCLQERDAWDRDKARRRAHIAALGYRIAMIVGDDLNDLMPARELDVPQRLAAARRQRDLAERGLWVLVPNPLFGSWLRAAAVGGDPAQPLSHRLGHRLDPRWPGE